MESINYSITFISDKLFVLSQSTGKTCILLSWCNTIRSKTHEESVPMFYIYFLHICIYISMCVYVIYIEVVIGSLKERQKEFITKGEWTIHIPQQITQRNTSPLLPLCLPSDKNILTLRCANQNIFPPVPLCTVIVKVKLATWHLQEKKKSNYYIKKENCQANDKAFSVQFWN